MYTCKTYEELEKIVNDWLNDDSDDDTGTEYGETTSTTSNNTAQTEGQKYKSLDEAFADLEDL